MDTHERLRQLLNERGWTEYRLAKNCAIVMPNPLQIASSVAREGTVFLL